MGKVLYDLTGRALVKYLLFRRKKGAHIYVLRRFLVGVNGSIPWVFRGGGRVEEIEGREKFT